MAGVLARTAAVLAVLAAGRAAARPAAFSLAWQAPAGCPDAASVRARIEQRLGHALDDVEVGIRVEVSPARGRYIAHLDLGPTAAREDVRTLTAAHCDELADAVALIVARVARVAPRRGAPHAANRRARRHLPRPAPREAAPPELAAVLDPPSPASGAPAVEPAALHVDAPAFPAPAAAPHHALRRVALREEPAAEARAAAPASPRTRTWSLGLRLSGISGIGVVPQVGIGGEVAATLRVRSSMFELAEARWIASSVRVRDGGPARVDVGLDVTAARVGWRSRRLPLRAWITAETGAMAGTGVGLSDPQVGRGRWLAVGAGFGVGWQMARWIRLVGTTEVLGAFERVRFSLADGVVVYTPSPVSARATLGLEVGWQ